MAKADYCCEEREEIADDIASIVFDGVDFDLYAATSIWGHMFVATILYCPWCGTELDKDADPAVEAYHAGTSRVR